MKKVLICILSILTFISLIAVTGEPASLDDSRDYYPVTFEIFENINGDKTYDEMKESDLFTKSDTDNFGFTSSVIWARFSITIHEKSQKIWFLEIGYPLLDEIDIYISDNNGTTHRKFGDTLPFNKRDINHHNFLIKLPRAPGNYKCLMRVKTGSNLNIPARILSEQGVIEDLNIQKTVFGIFYGILIIMIIYNLLLAASMKDTVYLWYSLFLVSMVFVSLSLNGYGFQYIWPNTVALNDIIPHVLFLTIITMILFSRDYLGSKEAYPRFDLIIKAYTVFCFIGFLSSFLLPYSITIRIGAAAYLPPIGMICYPMADSVIKGFKGNRYYTLAFSLLFAGVVVTVLNRFGLLSSNFFTLWGFQIGTVFSVALFSLGLAEKVNGLNRDLKELNENLECRVTERTRALNLAKEELEAAMSELEATNEHLIAANEELHETHIEYKKDLTLASKVQSSFFPSQVPFSDMYDVAFCFKPSSDISGDFYDFFYTPGKKNLDGIGLFDISGHGVSSGLITLLARSLIRRIYENNRETMLSTVTDEINRQLITELDAVDHYITGILLRFRNDVIEYVNCAHPAMMYRRSATGKTGLVINRDGMSVSGPFLGIQSLEEPFHEFHLKISSGDTLLLFTDCLPESRNKDDDLYGEIRVLESLEGAPDGSASEMLQYVLDEMFKFTGKKENFRDDLTVILLKKK